MGRGEHDLCQKSPPPAFPGGPGAPRGACEGVAGVYATPRQGAVVLG